MDLINDAQHDQLLENGRRRLADDSFDPFPVVKLFTPDANATWLLCDLDPENPDIAFGLCDLGLGLPELGSVRLSEIATVRGPFDLPVEQDLFFTATAPISAYALEAQRLGVIRA